MSSIELSIVTPGYNEEESIRKNLLKIKSYLDDNIGLSWELIFINDGSSDKTFQNSIDLSRNDNRIKIISYTDNRGRGYALRKGIEKAEGKYVLTIESDLNYGSKIIDELYQAIKCSNFDIIVASPYMLGGKLKNVPTKRSFLSRFGNKVLALSVGNIVHTVSGMVRIYRRDCIQSLPLVSEDKEIHLEIISKAISLNYKISEIPATLTWPKKFKLRKSTRKSSFQAKKYIISHILFSFSEYPLLLFGVIGGSLLLLGLGLGFYLAIQFIIFNEMIGDRIVFLIATMFFTLFGIQSLLFSFLAYQNKELQKDIYRIQAKFINKKN